MTPVSARPSGRARRRSTLAPYLFIAPALLGLVVFKLYPILVGLGASFLDYFNAVVTPLQVILALGLAVLVNRRLPGMAIFRSLFFVPAVISLVVASIV